MKKIIETCPQCGHDLVGIMLTTYPPIPRKECWNCGWSWTGKREEVIRVPFNEDNQCINTPYTLNSEQSACTNCSNHPKNGGSGICHCTLGLPKVT